MPSSVSRATPRPLLAALAVLATLLLPVSRAEAEPGIRILNSLTTQDLAFNALTTNRRALTSLTHLPLSTTSFATDSGLMHQLEDPAARHVMEYLVECALPAGSKVQWKDRVGTEDVFAGAAGLCPEWERERGLGA